MILAAEKPSVVAAEDSSSPTIGIADVDGSDAVVDGSGGADDGADESLGDVDGFGRRR